MGVGGDVVEEKNKPQVRTSVRRTSHERTAYALGFPEHAFPEHSPSGADLMVLFPFAPFAAIVLTARPKSQKARLRIGRIHELRFDDTLASALGPPYASMLVTSSIGCGSRDAEGIFGLPYGSAIDKPRTI